MAYLNTTRATQGVASDRFAGLLAGFKAILQRRAIYDQTVRELDSLSDRDLADLGIHRSQIGAVAKQAAYGN